MDGLDMVKNIKENWEICHIPIILLSAKSSLDDRISGLEQGIDDYITKPFSATYLKTRIKSLLQQRKELQAIFWKKWSEKQEKAPESATVLIPSQPKVVSQDELFMQQVMQVMEAQMENSELTVDEFAQLMNFRAQHILPKAEIHYRFVSRRFHTRDKDKACRTVDRQRRIQFLTSGLYDRIQ